ncbi:MAG: hypothetical protein ACYTGN_01460 [Planctomycetota bacterium]|jgi:hypothetical protein
MRHIAPLLLLVAACGFGAKTVERDRFNYTTAIAESWKTQMLSNIVKLRYMEAPVFMDVQQVLAGYTMEGSASAGWAEGGNIAQGWAFGGGGRFTDRPTITYRPVSGSEFAKSFMTPIPPHAIFFLIQAGFSADYVLPMCVQSINGLRNASGAKSASGEADDRFVRLVKAFATAQRLGALGMRVEDKKADKTQSTVLFFPIEEPTPEVVAVRKEIGDLLRLDDRRDFKVEYSTAPGGGDKIVMLTRSALSIMFELAVQIDVPEKHKAYAVPSPGVNEEIRLVKVHTGDSNPGGDAFVRFEYEDAWFWIRKDDLKSKRSFSFLKLLFGFVDKGAPPPPTLLTVPTG